MVVTELTPVTLQWTLPCPSLCPEPLVQSPQTACLKFCLARSIPFTSLLTGVGLLLVVWLLSFCFSCCWSTSLFPERCGSLASWVSCWLGCLCHFRSVRGLCSMGCYIQGASVPLVCVPAPVLAAYPVSLCRIRRLSQWLRCSLFSVLALLYLSLK